jgi:Fe2+ transport system protein FeoA
MVNQVTNAQPLTMCNESSRVHVKKISTDGKTQVRILGMGIGNGSNLVVMRNRGGDMVLAKNNIRISLGRSIAEKILVEQISG